MIAMEQQTPISPQAWLERDTRQFNLWWQATFLMLSLFAITLLLWSIDTRQLGNASVWAKPLKFESSLALYFITLALLAGYLPANIRMQATWRSATYIAVAAGVFEVIYIFLQAARGRASHYNQETTVESAMYGLMGLGALLLVAVSFYLGWLLYRDYQKQKQDTFKLASAYGLMLGSVLTLITAGIMSSGQTHFAGTPAADSWQVPVTGWLLSGGDLRIPHFFATHLMQFLPLYGLLLQRTTRNSADAQKNIVIFSIIYSSAVLIGLVAAFVY
ncbi:hypothetical protein AB833_18060 [Chromatiales bacterium (ex Bugula neritina AB1)]|nr:hypothetical protein AB833_18060 [Chromatiales bacterium (ex Bugula neritina AB1)]